MSLKTFVLALGYVKTTQPQLQQKMVVTGDNGEPVEFPAVAIAAEDKFTFVNNVYEMAKMLWDASEKQDATPADGYGDAQSADQDASDDSVDSTTTDETQNDDSSTADDSSASDSTDDESTTDDSTVA